ncbi:hypothetical protein N7457_000652 [Penicillium paradoxum]|uniref:uncharacterized protein n=1 Tax=Penicillium paradoxum TaxID=176176 RepID=UPI00254919C8|nr:uncharacterized protein N7457_000652 [Penicillium paradoxum]KAJ5794053.1 hypothetical protein N7457_000652 [Penicillium paradoxum]
MAQKGTPAFPIFLYSNFDAEALCQIASEIRRGPRCLCNLNQLPARGGFNWAVLLQFQDGVEWVFRSPVPNHPELSDEAVAKLLPSEVVTLRFLRKYVNLPVPNVYAYCADRKNPVQVPYILMSKADGKTLAMMWGTDDFHHRQGSLDIHISKVLYQLGHIAWKLAQFRFSQIGSLCDEDGYIVIGECLSRGHLQHKRCTLKQVPRGPFATANEFYDSLIAALTRHAEVLPLAPHCFTAPLPSERDFSSKGDWIDVCNHWGDFVTVGQKIDSAANRVDYLIASHALNDMIAQHESNSQGIITSSVPFSLCHPDLSVNNIFVDDQYNITCIIDWAFTTTVPLSWLLSPPGFPQSRNRLEDNLCSAFRDGFRDASSIGLPVQPEDLSIPRAIQCIENSQFVWCLARFLAMDSTDDLALFRTLWELVYPPEKKLESYFFSQRASSRSRSQYASIRLEDLSSSDVQKIENGSFSTSQQFELSVARHLTMVADWGFICDRFKCAGLRDTEQIFITEPRLWRWILAFKKDWCERIDTEDSKVETANNAIGSENNTEESKN